MALLLLGAGLAACGSEPEESSRPDAPTPTPLPQEPVAAHAPAPAAGDPAQLLPSAPTRSQSVEYASSEGRPLTGYLAYPAAAEGGLPAILLLHETLDDRTRTRADALAAQGYVVLAAEFGRAPERAPEPTVPAARPDAQARHLRQAHAYLREQIKATRIAAVGWEAGGQAALTAAGILAGELDAVVVYDAAVGADPELARAIATPVLGHFRGAGEDARRLEAALQSLGKPVLVHVYADAPAGFDEGPAARQAWDRTLLFLAEHLRGG